MTSSETTAEREIVVSHLVKGDRDLVFEAFTDVRHLSRWWGPEGFTTTTRDFSFTEGGDWLFTMHGPDGTDYAEWIRFIAIAPPERIELLHGETLNDPNAFASVFSFTPEGAATRVELRTLFPTKAMRDEAAEKYHAVEGGKQTLQKLGGFVEEILLGERAGR